MVTQGPLMMVVYLFLTTQWSVDSPESAEEFLSDVKTTQTKIVESESIASAWVDSTSALYKWEGYRDYLDLTDSIRDAYGYLYRGEAAQELVRRDAILDSQSGQTWVGFVDQGLLATAIDEHVRASECFERAIELNHHINNAPLRVLAGEAYLKRGLLANAQVQFASAIAKAESSGDRAFIFRVRQECTDALFDHGFLDAAVERAYMHFDTDYPLEKSWLLAQEIMYLWSLDEFEGATAKVAELASQIENATYSETSNWERKKYKQVQGILSSAQNAINGDPLSSMIIDVESADMLFKSGDAAKVSRKLERAVSEYPISNFSNYSEDEQEWSVWANFVYYASLSIKGELAIAEEGLRDILLHASYNSTAREPYVEAYCWLGKCLYKQGRFAEAAQTLQQALDLDAANAEFVPVGATDFLELHSIRGGVLEDFVRKSMVRQYWRSVKWIEDISRGGKIR